MTEQEKVMVNRVKMAISRMVLDLDDELLLDMIKTSTGNTRPSGTWIEDYQEDALPYNKRGWICSNCDSRTSYGTPPFCMRCGAKMEVKHE